MIRRPPRSTQSRSSAASDVYKRQLQSAVYFEARNAMEKAVILYIRGRNFKKALDLATKYKLYDYIKKITNEIGEDADPDTLNRVADYFLQNNQPDKAVHLLIASKQVDKALELCIECNVPITEDIFNKIVPDRPAANAAEERERQKLILLIAKKAKKQGNFELASKKYIQLGEKMKAIKCLILLGDIEKVVTFANNARIPEIFVLAGNFLQGTDWHNNPQLMKYIINFYGKAKAFDNLAGFYEACATLEIDEYRDYEKAMAALKEALKYAERSTSDRKEEKKTTIDEKIFFIEKFLTARGLAKSNPEEMIKVCNSLLENSRAEVVIRVGDVLAFLAEYHYARKDMRSAFDALQKMQARKILFTPYLDQEIIENIYAGVGQKYQKNVPRAPPKVVRPKDEEMEEDIREDN
eukprot:TRINITY_DN2090_c0_g1_i1.p1 TRINITY_DN2090_c0_g1~~TRINITY_DN2090_c0_g1_i1.p1  ORF type:complete len:410 (+),score=166.40 TRINITY_DN2090_c0_g1_i1:12-1241(+)